MRLEFRSSGRDVATGEDNGRDGVTGQAEADQCQVVPRGEQARFFRHEDQSLGMEGGSFEFSVEHEPEANPGPRGDDRVELLVSANPGIPPGPLRKVASGGELSRISLAVKVASKAGQSASTQVFDEVDAGIGGETANAVGRLLQSVARGSQTLCVTHLAQVAVCADQQFQVIKNSQNQLTQVETILLDEQERVNEIARMLGGRLSDQSRAHASELLASALTQH